MYRIKIHRDLVVVRLTNSNHVQHFKNTEIAQNIIKI